MVHMYSVLSGSRHQKATAFTLNCLKGPLGLSRICARVTELVEGVLGNSLSML